MSTESEYQAGDLTRLFNPTLSSDAVTASTSAAAAAALSQEKREKRDKAREAKLLAKQAKAKEAKFALMNMTPAKSHALSVAASILREKRNQIAARGARVDQIFGSKPVVVKEPALEYSAILNEDSDNDDYDGWSKNIEYSDDEDDTSRLLGLVPVTEGELRDHDVRVKDIDGDSDEEENAARKAEKNKKKRYDPKTDERAERTLFLGNIPIDTTVKEIEKICTPFGIVESTRFRSIAFSDPKVPKKVAFYKKQFHESRDTMTVYVVYATIAEAKAAVQGLHNVLFKEKHIRADLAASDAKADPYRSVFIGNVPFDANEETIREHFSRCGEVENIRLVCDKDIKIGKGFGFVTFVNKFSVEEALNLNGADFAGRKLRITKIALAAKKSTGKFAINAKRRLEERQDRKDSRFTKQREVDPMDVEAQPTPAKRMKLQGAHQKAVTAAGSKLTGGDAKKPRHVPREGTGKVSGILRPEAWMGERARIGDSIGRTKLTKNANPNKGGKGGAKGGKSAKKGGKK